MPGWSPLRGPWLILGISSNSKHIGNVMAKYGNFPLECYISKFVPFIEQIENDVYWGRRACVFGIASNSFITYTRALFLNLFWFAAPFLVYRTIWRHPWPQFTKQTSCSEIGGTPRTFHLTPVENHCTRVMWSDSEYGFIMRSHRITQSGKCKIDYFMSNS